MKKLNKKVIGIVGSVALAVGAFAIPAFAETPEQPLINPTTGITGGMMASSTMQEVMNSSAMQEAMTSGDVTKMTEAMNSPELKSIMGEEHVNQMTEYMKNGNMQAMHGQGGMMSGTGNMMSGVTPGNMMGNFVNQ